ncbi:putative bifunctional diguanylate cyclase/phosphodiesterase [Methyloraptor flagellatus]|jgi:diguanylate cyclase (GGDEF)-like protein|uniref:EAL domain-containing protein n=1 Tax=Methyloraptor flagellatus TaxID=3162530 RepID=A0AAU7XGQ6_9HYPH
MALSFAKICSLFQVPKDNPELVQAQFRAFVQQIPLLYGTLILNSLAIAYTYHDRAPLWLAVGLPVGLSAISTARAIWWIRQRYVEVTPERAYRHLTGTNRLAVVLAVVFTAWGLSLYGYGDAYGQGHIAFYMGLTVIACIFCLMHLRSAAIAVTLVVNVPFILFLSIVGETTHKAIAINLALVCGAMIRILFVYYRDFAKLVESRRDLIIKQAETQRLSDENLRMANLDSLTELPNRRRFFADLDRAFADAETEGHAMAVGILDLDGFKPVNDTFGHTTGDGVLIEAGRRMAEVCAAETGPCRATVYRLGGDEFGVLVTGDPSRASLTAIGHRLGEAVRRPYRIGASHAAISCSVGFALYPDTGTDGGTLFERADYALYHGKRSQRGSVVLFSREHEDQIRALGTIEQALRTADLERELSLSFQPILDVRAGRVVCFEALARWNSPTLGLVPPDRFIPIAERSGSIGDITRVLLAQALACLKTWPRDIGISFNLSAYDICAAEGAMRLIAAVNASGVDPRRVDFEITETAMAFDFNQARRTVGALKALGCKISLDDFGTGYSSLSYVHTLPLDRVKVDRSFVANIENDEVSHKIVRTIVGLCDDMNLECIVEGVETPNQFAIVQGMHCEMAQGYLFSKPMPAAEVSAYLARRPERQAGVA